MDSIEQLVMDTVTEQMTKRQHLEVTSKQLLRLLTSVSGYCAARLMVVNKLDSWLQNPKVGNHTLSLYIYKCLYSVIICYFLDKHIVINTNL